MAAEQREARAGTRGEGEQIRCRVAMLLRCCDDAAAGEGAPTRWQEAAGRGTDEIAVFSGRLTRRESRTSAGGRFADGEASYVGEGEGGWRRMRCLCARARARASARLLLVLPCLVVVLPLTVPRGPQV